jgi:eukaryotic-like serine/threonine-protein kinase
MRDPVRFARYLLLDRVAAGAMAEVFAARVAEGEGAGRLVAVKRLWPTLAEDPALVAMFLDEARIAVQLDHPCVARVDDLGQHGASYYIAMEYVPGKDLGALLGATAARGERVPVAVTAFVGAQVLSALDHAHARRDAAGRPLDVVHRDVSPRNVLLSFAGEVKLADFGLARAGARGAPEEPGVVRGRAGYVSPEQARGGAVDARSDLFSIGAVLHEMLTGEPLFAGPSDLLALERAAEGRVPSPRELAPEVPEPLARAVLDALARDPARRPTSAAALRERLAPYAAPDGAARLSALLAASFPEDLARERARGGYASW